jgi:ribonuclease HI
LPPEPEAHAYTDGASRGSRGAGGYGAVVTWNGKTEEISGGEPLTTNQRMEVTAACVALEAIDEGLADHNLQITHLGEHDGQSLCGSGPIVLRKGRC